MFPATCTELYFMRVFFFLFLFIYEAKAEPKKSTFYCLSDMNIFCWFSAFLLSFWTIFQTKQNGIESKPDQFKIKLLTL